MRINKNGTVRCQIHLYSEPELYINFKECINQLNENTGSNYKISEVIRALMFVFSKSAEMQQLTIGNIGGAGNE